MAKNHCSVSFVYATLLVCLLTAQDTASLADLITRVHAACHGEQVTKCALFGAWYRKVSNTLINCYIFCTCAPDSCMVSTWLIIVLKFSGQGTLPILSSLCFFHTALSTLLNIHINESKFVHELSNVLTYIICLVFVHLNFIFQIFSY